LALPSLRLWGPKKAAQLSVYTQQVLIHSGLLFSTLFPISLSYPHVHFCFCSLILCIHHTRLISNTSCLSFHATKTRRYGDNASNCARCPSLGASFVDRRKFKLYDLRRHYKHGYYRVLGSKQIAATVTIVPVYESQANGYPPKFISNETYLHYDVSATTQQSQYTEPKPTGRPITIKHLHFPGSTFTHPTTYIGLYAHQQKMRYGSASRRLQSFCLHSCHTYLRSHFPSISDPDSG
jgi:hypothetical protein